jgi:predicted transcriptional regulator
MELLQKDQNSESDNMVVASSSTASTVSDLVATFQEIKVEEQKLTRQKQELIATEKELQTKVVQEIEKKKKAIENLKLDIVGLQNKCDELTQALSIPVNH